ncbi:MAG: hypothetical protein KJZ91_14595 [Myxococcales bacterium]|nr:hypothetical protein [Myxococcales bacterium]
MACGGAAPPARAPDAPDDLPRGSAPAGPDGAAPAGPDAKDSPPAICARVFELKAEACPLAADYDLTVAECEEDFARSLDQRGPDARTVTLALAACLLDNASCAAASQCVAALAPERGEFRACGSEGTEPVAMARAAWTTRKAATVTRYSQATSTKEAPIEVCGIGDPEGQLAWLVAMTCDDGSRPFRSPDHAHAARVGNVGAGGRCGSIIDLYEVRCPERTYQIYLDAYVCPRD